MWGAKCSPSTFHSAFENREYPASFQNKSVSSSFKWVSKYYLLGQTDGESKAFFGGCKWVGTGGGTAWDYS